MSKPIIELVTLIVKLQKKHTVLKVPSLAAMESLVEEYGQMRTVKIETLTKPEIATRLDRLNYIEKQLRTFTEYHHGTRH